jgi:aminoglycoside N3'-acetyltransferase
VDGSVLLIGVDINRCSCMHQAEDRVVLPLEIEGRFELPPEIRARYPADEWYVEYDDPANPLPPNPWNKVQQEAERRGLIKRGRVGNAESLFFKANAVVDIYEEFLRKDPYEFFGVERA